MIDKKVKFRIDEYSHEIKTGIILDKYSHYVSTKDFNGTYDLYLIDCEGMVYHVLPKCVIEVVGK